MLAGVLEINSLQKLQWVQPFLSYFLRGIYRADDVALLPDVRLFTITFTKLHAWSPYIGEELPVQREVNNIHDDFAVAVLKNSNTVGHVPRKISRVFW